MSKLIIPGQIGSDPWVFEPSPFDPELDLVIVDCFTAEELCKAERTRPDGLVSIWDLGTHATEKYPWTTRVLNGIVLEFDDCLTDKPNFGYVAPKIWDVRQIVEHARGLSGRVVVHCAAGVSRSSASAVVIFATRFGAGREHDAVRAMLHARERTAKRGWRAGGVSPNMTIIALADEELGLDGALIEAIKDELDLQADLPRT